MTDYDEQKSPERYAIEQAIARLENDKDRVDAFMVHVKWILGSVGSFVLILVAGASFLGITSVKDIQDELAMDVASLVDSAIKQNEDQLESVDRLNSNLQNAQTVYEDNKRAIEALAILGEMEDLGRRDPQFAYIKLEELEDEEITQVSRGTALKLLESIIDAGQLGIADPNLLYNATITANTLSMQLEAAKLAALAAHWRPTASHRAVKSRTSEVLGREFYLEGGELKETSASPDEVRRSAWNTLLALVREGPRQEGEHIYANAWNVAVRNRSSGYYQEMINTIRESESAHPAQLSSYAYVMLARLLAHQGDTNWEGQYRQAVQEAVRRLKQEPPTASWYDVSKQHLVREAHRLDRLQPLLELATQEGLEL
ncbi:MAG: hypothetical protein OXF33_06350 [Rhodospirillales bacterium]|nr:hypothetical protein [Rhodospirillales bacterium]